MNTEQIERYVSIRPSAAPLSQVLAYSNPDVIERIARDHQMPIAEAESIFNDTVRFLYLAGATDAQHLVPTKNIDKGWHSFLMFTRDYSKFCETYFGRFIHHEPRRNSDPVPTVDHFPASLEIARNVFGPTLSTNWRHELQAADCEKNPCNSQCSPDTGGAGSECSPSSGD